MTAAQSLRWQRARNCSNVILLIARFCRASSRWLAASRSWNLALACANSSGVTANLCATLLKWHVHNRLKFEVLHSERYYLRKHLSMARSPTMRNTSNEVNAAKVFQHTMGAQIMSSAPLLEN